MHEVRLGKIPTLTWSCFARSTKVICKTWVGQTNSASQSQFVLRTMVNSLLSVRSVKRARKSSLASLNETGWLSHWMQEQWESCGMDFKLSMIVVENIRLWIYNSRI